MSTKHTKEVHSGIVQGITEESVRTGRLPNVQEIASMILAFAYSEIAQVLFDTLDTSRDSRADLAIIFEQESREVMLGKIK